MIPTDILNYRVVRLLGSGGMGSVYLAANTNIDQQVAIKALRPEVASNVMLRTRFKQEAELLCSLDHPGIVKFLNYVEIPEGVFLIMEYVKGITLEDFIKKKNGLIVEKKAYPMICEILDAFAYAHSRGIVHRDIKPSNIIVQDDGHIKVMDFGIAQIVSETNASDNNAVMGTPTYMSPEQVYGKNIDIRSDIYSLGVLIHNMLTGRAPYDSTTMTAQEIKRHIVNDAMLRMADYYPYVSNKIQQVVDKATQKIPEARYQTCEEMKHAVKKAIAPDPIPRPLFYAGLAATFLLLVGGILTWDYFRTKVDYYKDYVEIYGIPKGIGSLSRREVSHRAASYKFEYSRYKLRRVTYINSKGKLVDHHDSEDKDKIVDMTLTYTEGSGKIDAAKYMNRSGKVLYVKDYDSNFKTCTFKLDDELGTEMTLNSQVNLFQSAYDIQLDAGKGKISKHILEYDDKGRLTKVEYAGFGNIRVPDGQGLFGRRYVYDKKDRVAEEHYLGKDGNPKATQFSLGIKLFTYDNDDNLTKIEYQTTDGKPSSDGNNCPIVLLTYDRWGNRQTEKYTDANGQLMLRKDSPFAGIIYEYDEAGFNVKRMMIGLDGGITYCSGCCGTVFEYDANGYVAKMTMVDESGSATFSHEANNDGRIFSKVVVQNDEKGNTLDLMYLDAFDELIDGATWVHSTCTYDSIGNQLSEYYYDREGNMCAPALLGYAGIAVTYTPQGRLETVTYLDANKERTNLSDSHFCYFKNEYDARGNYIRQSYYDTDDKLAMTDHGCAVICYEYDDNGNEVARYFLDNNEKPCVPANFCSRCEKTYDEQGNIISERYKNTDGKPMLVDGMAGFDQTYDARGNVVVCRPISLSGGLAAKMQETRYKYDERDNRIEEAYFDAKGNATNCSEGFHKIVCKYNSRNQDIQRELYNTRGLLTNAKGKNYAVIKKEFDERSNNISTTYFTQTGSRGTDDNKVHKYYNQFDKIVNKVCHQISFGIDGKPIVANGVAKEGRIEYDKRGNMLKLVCYDGYGTKCNGEQGWCETRYTYDESNLPTSEAYFTIDDKPFVDRKNKYHKVVFTYNSMRLKESETYYGANSKPTNTTDGFSTIKYKYNNQNLCTEFAYYGVNGKATNNNAGWHRVCFYYKNGSACKHVFYDVAGRKVGTSVLVNGQWEVQAEEPENVDWKIVIAEFAKTCPCDIDNGIIEKIQYSDEAVLFHLKNKELDGDELSEKIYIEANAIKEQLRNHFKIPSHVSLHFVIYNKYDKKLATL